MTSAPDNADHSPRLVRFLSELSSSSLTLSHSQFAGQLAELIGLSDAFALSDTLRGLKRLRFNAVTAEGESLQAAFMEQRASMMALIVNSFIPGQGRMPFILPEVSAETLAADVDQAFEAYRRFYSNHQNEMEFRAAKLRALLRRELQGRSARLAKLVALDTALADTLAEHVRKTVATTLKCLARRFQFLRDQQQADAGGLFAGSEGDSGLIWQQQFIDEMQGLLLAELAFRLLPTVGLLEALNEEMDAT